ncbi:MAG: InlB B-repeat-containing protein, partial [Oscillospiraceae bacterium]|nr:InlB B-repeat-containing protein [Oscillospiraceae bacterium]
VGSVVNADWSVADNAQSYLVSLICTTNAEYSQPEREVSGTNTYYVINNPGTYKISVKAKNSTGQSQAKESGTITINPNLNVTFKNWDDTTLLSQSVPYGGVASAPFAPSRVGYTFQGWDKNLENITTDQTITAKFAINKYTVKFTDNNGDVIETQTVEYGNSAEPPVPTNPSGYNFVCWDKDDYLNVTEDMTVKGIYVWENPDLPNIIEVQSAVRNQEASGYNVTFNLKNAPLGLVRGRVIVALKTTAGKMVAAEPETYYLDKLAESPQTIFVPYSGVAKIAEISIVGLVEDENTGVPLAETVATEINLGETEWSDWLTELPEKGDYVTETREESRIQEKEITTRNFPTLENWTLIKTEKTGWTDWSSFSTTPYAASSEREVETRIIPGESKTMWHYYRWTNGSGVYSYKRDSSYWYEEQWFDRELPVYNNGASGTAVVVNGSGIKNAWIKATFSDAGNKTDRTWTKNEIVSNGYTEWRYRDVVYTYTFEKWGEWSEWQAGDIPTESENRKVETRNVSRYKADETKLIENAEGITRNVSGKIATPGKLLTLLVFKQTNVDPTASQLEYVAQTVVDEDGNYSFDYITKEEPNEKTGDFIVVVAPEGGTSPIYVETIKAPKAEYTVVFQDELGEIISTQTVTEGNDAIVPVSPEKQGYDFIGWNQDTTNILKDTTLIAEFSKKKYQVGFVDWSNQAINFKEFEYGDILFAEEIPFKEGNTFKQWVDSDNNPVTTVIDNMVVTAQYTPNEYIIKILDWNGETISEQTIPYGGSVELPVMNNPPAENMLFAGWNYESEAEYVTEDMILSPVAVFQETVSEPKFSNVSNSQGEHIKLTCDTPNAIIVYTTDGTMPECNIIDGKTVISGNVYTSPILLSENETNSIVAIAFAPEKNTSPVAMEIYDSEMQTSTKLTSTLKKIYPTSAKVYVERTEGEAKGAISYILLEGNYSDTDFSNAKLADMKNHEDFVKLEYSNWTKNFNFNITHLDKNTTYTLVPFTVKMKYGYFGMGENVTFTTGDITLTTTLKTVTADTAKFKILRTGDANGALGYVLLKGDVADNFKTLEEYQYSDNFLANQTSNWTGSVTVTVKGIESGETYTVVPYTQKGNVCYFGLGENITFTAK